MNKLGILIKNYLLLAWGEMKYKKKKNGRSIGSVALIVILGAFLIFTMGSSAVGQIYAYQPFGMAHIALAYSLMLALVVSLLMAIMRGSMGSNTADAELLLLYDGFCHQDRLLRPQRGHSRLPGHPGGYVDHYLGHCGGLFPAGGSSLYGNYGCRPGTAAARHFAGIANSSAISRPFLSAQLVVL